jgi:hypothetical protein
MHLRGIIPADEMPPMSKGNQNFPSDEMPLTNEGNHDFHDGIASSSLGQVNTGFGPFLDSLTQDDLALIIS